MTQDTKVVSVRVDVAAWDRANQLAKRFGVRLSDVVSLALICWDDDQGFMTESLKERAETLSTASTTVASLVKKAGKLSPAERAALKRALS
jgi:antitoxin component of RelBE/YafQ-DinJ toxin-antitoxin module